MTKIRSITNTLQKLCLFIYLFMYYIDLYIVLYCIIMYSIRFFQPVVQLVVQYNRLQSVNGLLHALKRTDAG